MPEFTGQITDPSVRPFIQRGVQDNSTASILAATGAAVHDVASRSAVNTLTGGAQSIDEVAPGLADPRDVGPVENLAAERMKQIEGLDTLSKISAARKSGLRGDIAKARAGVALRKALSDSPAFAPEIRKAFSGFFKSSTDTGFFVDPKRTLSPEEKGRAASIQATAKLAEDLNISLEEADQLQSAQVEDQFRVTSLTNKNKLGEGDVTVLTSSLFNSSSRSVMGEYLTTLKGNGNGVLTTDQVQVFKAQLPQILNSMESAWLSTFKETRPTQAQVDAFNTKKKEMTESMGTFLKDQGLQKLMADNAELFTNSVKVEAIKSFRNIAVIRSAWGDAATSKLFDALSSNEYKSFLDNNEAFRSFFSLYESDPDVKNRIGSLALDYILPDSPVTRDPVTLNAVAGISGEPEVMTQVPKEKIQAMFEGVPSAVIKLNTPKWRAAVDGGYPVKNIEDFLKSAMKRHKSDYVSEHGKVISNLATAPVEPLAPKLGGIPTPLTVRSSQILDQDGKRVSNALFSTFNDSIGVANRYPELWEGDFDSSEEYVKSLIVPRRVTEAKETATKGEPQLLRETIQEARDFDFSDTEHMDKVQKEHGARLQKEFLELMGRPLDPNAHEENTLSDEQKDDLLRAEAKKNSPGLTNSEIDAILFGVD